MTARVLIADDDPGIRLGLSAVLRDAGHDIYEAGTGREAVAMAKSEPLDLILLDLVMPDGEGLEVLPELVALPEPPAVVVLTGYADVTTAVRAMRLGATNLIEKPVGAEALNEIIERVLAGRSLRDERDRLRDELSSLRSGAIIGRSRAIRHVLEHVARVAQAPHTTVLITGESGVGKELVARAVHERSDAAEQPFVALNCAALAENLLEAELFGYAPGAFTGGHPKGHAGLVEAAGGGILFLDEIGELASHLQAKLLRVLQERTYRRIGENRDRPLEARVIAATNRDLVAMVDEGTFREDLFYRLNVLSILVPPLRERPEDIAPMAVHFLAQFADELGRHLTGFSEAAMERMRQHAWPGNVRELRNMVERAALLAQEGMIRPEHLGLEAPGPATSQGQALASYNLRDMEEVLIREAIRACEGNRSAAARELGINRATLYNKLKVYDIQ